MESKKQLIKILREASQVRRMHTARIIGEYTDGQHAYDAAMLLVALHPDPSADLIKAVLVHDVAERWVGDVPATVKWGNFELGERLEDLEHDLLRRLNFYFLVDLSEEDYRWIDAVDKLELYLFCLDQRSLGNRNVRGVLRRLRRRFRDMSLPEPIESFINNLNPDDWERTTDELP